MKIPLQRFQRHSLLACALVLPAVLNAAPIAKPFEIGGIFPHLAMFNDGKDQTETGVGGVVPFAGKLWVITYSAHDVYGGGDGLFEINPDLTMTRRPESIGGTPANRYVDRGTNQLFLGPYVIDAKGGVKAFSYENMQGRYTATCADPFKPNSVLTYTMEEGTYRIDPKTLKHEMLFADGNAKPSDKTQSIKVISEHMLPGYHGKGAWGSQGVFVVANNGQHPYKVGKPTGVLAEWDGKPGKDVNDVSPWRVVRRNQFTEVTGPGGVYGPVSNDAPIWAVGWDKRSVILACRDKGEWSFRRLAKGSFTYDAEHGWNTEWPRIRDVEGDPGDGKGRHLMTMHGQLWDFDASYRAGHFVAPKPLTGYLKILGDFAAWKTHEGERIVFGCDDVSAFANPLAQRSQSNLLFVKPDAVADIGGPALGWGAVWLDDAVRCGEASDAMSIAGYDRASLTLSSKHEETIFFTVQHDADGSGQWKTLRVVKVLPNSVVQEDLSSFGGGWVRITSSADANGVSAVFQMAKNDSRSEKMDAEVFAGLAKVGEASQTGYGFVQGLPDRGFNLSLNDKTITLNTSNEGFVATPGMAKEDFDKVAVPKADPLFEVAPGAVIVREGKRVWRLPRHSAANDAPPAKARMMREVTTERQLLNIGGSFFEVPRMGTIGVGIQGLRPIASHDLQITDFAPWRGLMLMTGVKQGAKADGKHLFDAGDAGQFWAGSIDDLWKLGKPRGTVMDFNGEDVAANQAGDPCLMHGYDKKSAVISHAGGEPLRVAVQINVNGDGQDFFTLKEATVKPGESLTLPLDGVVARWARIVPLDAAKGLKAGFRYE